MPEIPAPSADRLPPGPPVRPTQVGFADGGDEPPPPPPSQPLHDTSILILVEEVKRLYAERAKGPLTLVDQDAIVRVIQDLRDVESNLVDQLALQKAVSREFDPRKTPLIRPEDRPELHLERLLTAVQAVLADAVEISQDLPKNRQNS